MEEKVVRYEIKVKKSPKKTSYFEAASIINRIQARAALLDPLFETMVYTGKKNDLTLTFPNLTLTDLELATILYKEHRYYLNKMYPGVKHDIYFEDHYGVDKYVSTIGKPLEKVRFCYGLGGEFDLLLITFPKGFTRDFGWYQQLLTIAIEELKADYGALRPMLIRLFDPPMVTGGWVSYFAPRFGLGDGFFAGSAKIPVLDNEFLYALENRHMIVKNEEQQEKLRLLVDKFKELDIQI